MKCKFFNNYDETCDFGKCIYHGKNCFDFEEEENKKHDDKNIILNGGYYEKCNKSKRY